MQFKKYLIGGIIVDMSSYLILFIFLEVIIILTIYIIINKIRYFIHKKHINDTIDKLFEKIKDNKKGNGKR